MISGRFEDEQGNTLTASEWIYTRERFAANPNRTGVGIGPGDRLRASHSPSRSDCRNGLRVLGSREGRLPSPGYKQPELSGISTHWTESAVCGKEDFWLIVAIRGAQMRHVWMPPVMQVFSADKLGIVISCGHVSGLDQAAFHEPRACMEIGGSSPNQKCELVGSLSHAGCFDPVLLTVFPYLFCEFLTSSTSSGGWSVV
jgi:hypothetical protein